MDDLTPDRFERANQLFSDALDLPEEQRDDYVRGACGQDTGLCASVLKLLSRFRGLGDFLEKPAAAEERLELAPGDVLDGRIKIVELHGRGGMGEVYRAEDIKLGEPVAIKVIRAEWRSDPGMLARFRDEIKLARRISHPNVCRVHGIVTATVKGRELVCLEMEYLAGPSIAELLSTRGKLETESLLRIAEGVAAGLDAAHREGVMHRDLKPGNIILAQDRRGGDRPVITDFGLARSEEPGEGGHTQSGVIAGSPDYMAPEQFMGEKLTAAVDVFAFGLIVYEMAAGRRPYPSESIVRAAVRRLTETPPPLSRVAPEAPRHWDRVLGRALARDPARRYTTAGAMLAELRERPSRAALAFSSLRKPRVSRRYWLAGSGAAGAVAVASFYEISRLHNRALPEAPLIMLTPLASSDSPANAAALGLQMEKGLQQSAHVQVLDAGRISQAWKRMRGGAAFPGKLQPRDAREIALREGAQFVLFGNLEKVADGWAAPLELDLLGTTPEYPKERFRNQFDADSEQGLLTAAAKAVAWIRRQAGESAEVVNARSRVPEAITTKSWPALQEYMQAEVAWSERQAEGRRIEDQAAAAELHLKRALEFDPEFALAAARLADIQVASNKFDDGMLNYQRAARILDVRNFTDRESLEVRGMFAYDTGQYNEAGQIFGSYALAYPREARPLFMESSCEEHLGRRDAALRLMQEASDKDPGNYAFAMWCAIYLLFMGRFTEASAQCEKAARLYDHDWTDQVRAALAFARQDLGGVKAGIQRMRTAGSLPYRSKAFTLEACLHAEQGRWGEAEASLKQGIQFDADNRQPADAAVAKQRALALVYIQQNRSDQARAVCEQMLAGSPARRTMLEAGRLLARAGDLSGARRCVPAGLPKDPPAEPPTDLPAGVPPELMAWPIYWRGVLLLWGEIAMAAGDAKRAFQLARGAPVSDLYQSWPGELFRASLLSGENQTAKGLLAKLLANPAAYWLAADASDPGFFRKALQTAERFKDLSGNWASWKRFL